MSGRERLRRGWLRFGKVGRKPNKDGKNRLCLEKNRCREEEESPWSKGISKRVIVVKSPDPKNISSRPYSSSARILPVSPA